jgi:hypothetical protein
MRKIGMALHIPSRTDGEVPAFGRLKHDTRSRLATTDVVFAPSRIWTAVLARLRLSG